MLMLGPLGPPHVADQALALRDRGFDVEVGGNSPPDLEDSVIEDAGIPVHHSPAGERSTPWGIASTVRWAKSLIRRFQPDVVNAHWLPGFGFAAAAAGASPLVLTAWGSDVYRANTRMRLASRFAVHRADLVLADSRDLLRGCVRLGAPEDRTELIQWGVDLSLFSPPVESRGDLKARLGLGSGPVILSPRSLMPVYNIPTILDAFDRLGRDIPDAQLVLKHMGAVRIDVGPLPHPERVHVVGKVPYELMAAYYRAADVCVSVPSSDGSPRSVWEAMACGCPCVVSELPWVREIAEEGVEILPVAIDPAAIAAELERVITTPAVRETGQRRGPAPCRAQARSRGPGRPACRASPAGGRLTVGSEAPTGARIEVAMPCRNDGATVEAAVRSIVEDEPVSLVIIDDASDDPATREALARLEADGSTVLRNEVALGVSASRMAGLAATDAPFDLRPRLG